VDRAFESVWKILLAGLILGAGLPAVFPLGIRSLAYGAGGDADRMLQEATPADVVRVSAHLAAGGWPLADPPAD
jgi:hypothetical protein